MKIAFPTQENQGDKSAVYGHFGSAEFFILIDADTDESQVVVNSDLNHTHGKCQPLVALGGNKVDAVVVGGIGGGALRKLRDAGIKVYRAVEGSVSENFQLIKTGKLPEFSMDHTCSHHHGNEGCIH